MPKPEGRITLETIASALPQRDLLMQRRSCILESCLAACPARGARAEASLS